MHIEATASLSTVCMQVKQALWNGGIQRSNKPPEKRHTPGLNQWEDLVRPSNKISNTL